MRKINNGTLFLYGTVITSSAFLIIIFTPQNIFRTVFVAICGICVGNIISSLAWGEKQ